MEIKFSIPGKPAGKARPRMTRTGHAYTPKRTRDYEKLVRASYAGCGFMDGPIGAEICAYFKPGRKEAGECTKRPDADNIAKIVLDALNGVAYKDDAQITKLIVTKQYGDERVEVSLWEI